MSDVWQQLPFSQRRAGEDESSVSSDWRPYTGRTLMALASALDSLTDEQWASDALTPRRGHGRPSVAETIADLVRALEPRALLRRGSASAVEPTEMTAALRHRGEEFAAGSGRRGLGALTAVVQHAYDVTVPLEVADPVEPRASGAVALGLAAAAPTPLRGVLVGRSLVAADADWLIGAGPAIRGTAGELVCWLGGRDVTPFFDRPGAKRADSAEPADSSS
ncbi:hypothetical protein ACFSBZ_13100 [Amnibacterium flavum]|uniref:Mycothiol-dependent maleylpyruvate isomerase metal-binding domain-containing protein n=1 Tax=Amnibacterium flavum TaxID=2173173 RepID=A0A2V1HWX3_9MICO|nr:hypothetical protein [Amnibacterium flavum]PVZ95710.1 hypothetical protein DDQ50_04305 [Amnibacterium flavum]